MKMFKLAQKALLIGVVSLGNLLILEDAAMARSEVAPEVSLDEFKQIVESKSATIIDANGNKSYQSGHVPGAIHYAKVEENFAPALPKDKAALIVAYCGGPMCTAWEDPAKAAQKLGYTNVKHYKGGIRGWKAAGLAVEK